jgi:hypothetical protein
MYQVIIFLGIFLALVGVGTIAAGAPSWALGLGLGSSLIQSGSIGLVGGFLLVGIGFVLRALHDLSRRIDMIGSGAIVSRPMASALASRPMAKREPPPSRREPPLGSQRDDPDERLLADEADDGALEDRPRGRSWPPVTDSRPSAETRANERPRAPAVEPRMNERPRPSAADPALSGRSDFAGGDTRRPRFAPERPPMSDGNRPPERAPDMRGPRGGGDSSTTVVRSGIIHGMAYTLYADGSIEAELPIGTVRFASIEELQDHVSRTGDEADVDFAGKSN